MDAAARERRFRLTLAAILLAAFVLRIVARAVTGPEEFFANSYGFYLAPAQALAEGRGYVGPDGVPLTERPPLYALFVGGLRGYRFFWPILLAQALVSTGTVACTALLARRFGGGAAGLLAAAIATAYPYYLRHDTALQETGLLTFLTALAMLSFVHACDRRSSWLALAAGGVLGLAALTRPTVAPMIPIAAAWLVFAGDRAAPLAQRMRPALLALAAGLVLLAPWMVRQHALLDRWALTSDFGRALFVGNNPDTFASYPRGSIDVSQALAFRHIRPELVARFGPNPSLRDPAVSDWLRNKGADYIRAHPGHFVAGALRKNLAAFGPLPSPRHGLAENLAHALSYGPVLVLAFVGMWQERRRWQLHSLTGAQFLVFIVGTGLLWGHTSHRAYLDVYLIVFAAIALAAILRRFSSRSAA